ncbi:ABC transporter substrate-binding protein [Rothia terrae]|uniref:ABC transporter substrate-binding protein n=1 Tax=Rothia terrae TaxID=396015 RepID=A0A7H2BE50_9MICC|nr:ABC transporter substrate-binding protein [Rothia terrae]QNV37946.1 ABC transporter substrate-binding protein [Rothia terrae]
MKHTRATTFYVSLALAGLVALTGCGQSVTENTAQSSQSQNVSLENCGEPVDFATNPERIVALNPGQADLMARLGAGDKVIGVAPDQRQRTARVTD